MNIRHDLSRIWEPPSVEDAERALDAAVAAYDANPTPATQAAVHDAVFDLEDAAPHEEES